MILSFLGKLPKALSKTPAIVCGPMLMLAASAPVFAEPPMPRFPVPTDAVIMALVHRRLPEDGMKVQFAAPITSSVEAPALEVQSLSLLNERSVRVRLSCVVRSECLPFYASASWPDALDHGTMQFLAAGDAAQKPSVIAATSKTEAAPKTPQAAPTVHAGARATLLIDDDRIHIRVPVICLQNGLTGDKVRVTTPDRKQGYVAEIVTPSTLKGVLSEHANPSLQ